MVVMILENVPVSVRGELTRWLLELRTGVFVGKVSAMVRDKLWENVCSKAGKKGGGFLIHPANTEQGYVIRSAGTITKTVEDYDGLLLICKSRPHPKLSDNNASYFRPLKTAIICKLLCFLSNVSTRVEVNRGRSEIINLRRQRLHARGGEPLQIRCLRLDRQTSPRAWR